MSGHRLLSTGRQPFKLLLCSAGFFSNVQAFKALCLVRGRLCPATIDISLTIATKNHLPRSRPRFLRLGPRSHQFMHRKIKKMNILEAKKKPKTHVPGRKTRTSLK